MRALALLLLAGLAQAAPCADPDACRAACEAGDGAACNDLGARHYTGEGVPRDDARARALYGKACAAGDPAGCTNHGWMLLDGEGGRRDPAAADGAFQRACVAGDAVGCGGLGVVRAADRPGEARALCEKGCTAGDPRACATWLLLLEPPALAAVAAAPPATLRPALTEACAAPDAEACAALALIEADPTRRAAALQTACAGGHARGCAALGEAKVADPTAAVAAFERGCDLGDGAACRRAGELTPDARGAARHLQRACDLADAAGCGALAAAVGAGRGVRADRLRSRLLHGLACEGGHGASCPSRMDLARDPDDGPLYNAAALRSGRLRQQCNARKAKACLELADMRLTGTGVRRDAADAADLYARACARKLAAACARAAWARP